MEAASFSEMSVATNIHFAIFASLHFTSLHLVVEPPTGITKRHFSRSRSIALSHFHPIPLSFKIFRIPSSQVCRCLSLGLFPCVLACQVIFGYLSSSILVMCPNYLSCTNYIMAYIPEDLNFMSDSVKATSNAFLDSFNDTF